MRKTISQKKFLKILDSVEKYKKFYKINWNLYSILYKNNIMLILDYIKTNNNLKGLIGYYIVNNINSIYKIIYILMAAILKLFVFYFSIFPPLVYIRVLVHFIMGISGNLTQDAQSYLDTFTNWYYDPIVNLYKKIFGKFDFTSKIFILITVGHISKLMQNFFFNIQINLLKNKI